MVTRVVEHASARQVRLCGIASAGLGLQFIDLMKAHSTLGLSLVWGMVIILVLVIIVPAVWSCKAYRRKAGRDVLSLIMGSRG
jgi:hypothetical protein